MAIVTARELLETGIHFGHRVSRWNPRMRPYIFGKRNGIHILDIEKTLRGIITACKFLARLAAREEAVLFVGTKRQARLAIGTEARRCGMPFVNEKWRGGVLTNYGIIRSRLARLAELEALDQGGGLGAYSKKMVASLMRERHKLEKNLSGIRTMERLPSAMVIVDPKKEKTALKEAVRIKIPVIALIDTDCDPDAVDIPIPGNDDGIRSIGIVLRKLADAVLEGRALREARGAVIPMPRAEPAGAPAAAGGAAAAPKATG